MSDAAPLGMARVAGFPVIGAILPLSRDALGFFAGVLRERGDRVRLRILGRSILLLCHPRDIEHVLLDDRGSYGRPAEIRKLRPIFGLGLLASDGELWRRQRALVQPSFAHAKLGGYAEVMLSRIRAHVSGWQHGEVREVHGDMMRYTRETICAVLFGERYADSEPALGAAVSTVFGSLRSEVLYLALWRRLQSRRSREWNRAVRTLNSGIQAAIRNAASGDLPPQGLLEALLRARDEHGKSMTEQQVHDEIVTFFLAGHETTALSLTWTLQLLARHPAIQEKLHEEIRTLTGGEPFTADVAAQLTWTQAAVKEALRLYPPVWSMGREASRDTTLGGHRVRKGTDVWICLYRLQRDARWFEDPERFVPQRWLGGWAPKRLTYLPFGVGPRACIGQHFATVEAVLGVAEIIRNFKLATLDTCDTEPSAWITLRPKTPIRLRITKRVTAPQDPHGA